MKEPAQHSKDLLPLVEATYDQDGVQATSEIGADGKEYPDPVPMAPPVGYQTPPTIIEMIRTMIHSEKVRDQLEAEGFETFEEAEDFYVEDDPPDPTTPYEEVFYPPKNPPPDVPLKAGEPPKPDPKKLLDTSSLGDTSTAKEPPAKQENPSPKGP